MVPPHISHLMTESTYKWLLDCLNPEHILSREPEALKDAYKFFKSLWPASGKKSKQSNRKGFH